MTVWLGTRGVRPVAFDFDGTLSDSEMVVLLAEAAGVADRVAEVTQRAMDGDLAYAESLRERVGLLAGVPVADAEAAFGRVELRPGAGELLADLREASVPTAVFTGGFDRGVAAALTRAGTSVDRTVANRVRDDGTTLTGDVEGPLVEGTKDDALREWCADLDTDPAEAVAVGDGANDRPMLEVAGLAVGFDPKPSVAPACDVVVADVAELREVFVAEGLLSED